MEEPRIALIGTRLAPGIETMRWLCEQGRIAYEERSHLPGLHIPISRWRGIPDELPLVASPTGTTGGLSAALAAFDARCRPGERLFGESEAERIENRALIERLRTGLLIPGVKIYYRHMLEARRAVLAGATQGIPLWQKIFAQVFFGLWRMGIRRGLGLENFDEKKARDDIDAVFTLVKTRTKAKGPFLGGASPGGLDIIFAAAAAPVLLPENYGAALPAFADLPPDYRSIVNACRATHAGGLAARIYATRTKPQLPMQRPREEMKSILSLFLTPGVLRGGARLAARWAPRRIGFGKTVLAFRWADVADILRRDGDLLIAPINAKRITAVAGPFILGMDRSPELFKQREAVYSALRGVSPAPIADILKKEPQRLLIEAAIAPGSIDIVNGYARPVAARVAASLFGIKGPSEAELMRVARAVFHETFLNLGDDGAVRNTGIAAGAELTKWIEEEYARRETHDVIREDLLGRLMMLALRREIRREEVSHILAGLLVGSIDTTATAAANIVSELTANRDLAEAVARDALNIVRLRGWCAEILRRRPHNPILLREATANAGVAGTRVAAGTRVIAVTLSAMQDARVFGSPEKMNPDRDPALYMHFGYGIHLCAGRDLNAVQIPALIAALLPYRPFAPTKIRDRGPFPDELILNLEPRA
ncbi:hypothetical protein IZ6_19860 [Terrihabitans soli]|uniref:Cytochrome P450 n=1 Tax=Terrihabitans soli TaxID=708113 RepID=A0A6S6QW21_9HYPH|nr:cytochrome P450 [Terrihabitans soli]BCJ91251.1 hypothetical protein IZ6_19860 [Terrihabitans soli]